VHGGLYSSLEPCPTTAMVPITAVRESRIELDLTAWTARSVTQANTFIEHILNPKAVISI
jgi:hypothetical protein